MIRLRDVRFGYGAGTFELAIEELAIARGERVACIGPSGTGKTTLVHLIAGILTPTRGTIELGDSRVATSSSSVPRARSSANTRIVTSGTTPTSVRPRVCITGKKTVSQRLT